MQTYIEAIFTLTGTVLAVLIAGLIQYRSSKRKLQAEADKLKAEATMTYQNVALQELKERERLEERFERKLGDRDTKIDQLSKEIECLHAERGKIEKERDMERELWRQEKALLVQKIDSMERTHNAERKSWSLEKETMQSRIEHLESEIKQLKAKTGGLKETHAQ